jgi:hypothetical protein
MFGAMNSRSFGKMISGMVFVKFLPMSRYMPGFSRILICPQSGGTIPPMASGYVPKHAESMRMTRHVVPPT